MPAQVTCFRSRASSYTDRIRTYPAGQTRTTVRRPRPLPYSGNGWGLHKRAVCGTTAAVHAHTRRKLSIRIKKICDRECRYIGVSVCWGGGRLSAGEAVCSAGAVTDAGGGWPEDGEDLRRDVIGATRLKQVVTSKNVAVSVVADKREDVGVKGESGHIPRPRIQRDSLERRQLDPGKGGVAKPVLGEVEEHQNDLIACHAPCVAEAELHLEGVTWVDHAGAQGKAGERELCVGQAEPKGKLTGPSEVAVGAPGRSRHGVVD